jgi:hypothetical protein
VSRSRQITITRTYKPEADACLRALMALLEKSVKEGGPDTALKDDVKESNGYVATKNHNR